MLQMWRIWLPCYYLHKANCFDHSLVSKAVGVTCVEMKGDDSMDSIGFEVKNQSMGVNSVKALRELCELPMLHVR